jgi:MarR family transcriptional regulator, organic hydroperoxide resistance regulator
MQHIRSKTMSRQSAPKAAKLGDFLCFAVYSANLAFGRAYRPILDQLGLTYTQYVTLVAMSEAQEQTVGELGERLFLESNTLTPILKKLEQLGLVVRRRDPADERQVRVNLTEAGRKLRQQVESDASRLFEATGLGDDFARVQQEIARLRDNLLRSTQS